SVTKVNVALFATRSGCQLCVSTNVGSGYGVSSHMSTPTSYVCLPSITAPNAAVLSRCNAAFTSLVGPSRNHSCNRGPPTPIGKSAPTFGPATKPSRDIDLLMTTLPTPPPLLL